MNLPHSPAAALVDACDCQICVFGRIGKTQPRPMSDDPMMWHLWTIRSPYASKLAEHRSELERMGFTVGRFEINDELSRRRGRVMYSFSAKIPKACLSEADYQRLVQWDRENAGDD